MNTNILNLCNRLFSMHSENRTRGYWPGRLDFIIVTVGYMSELTQTWSLPFVCIHYGGVPFMLAFTLSTLLLSVPAYYIEIWLGQFSGKGVLSVWAICPIFKGVGYATLLVNFLLSVSNIFAIGWTFFYMALSMSSTPIWSTCGNWWNYPECIASLNKTTETQFLSTWMNYRSYGAEVQHLRNRVLNIEGKLKFQWEIFLCIAAALVIICCALTRGVRSISKVCFITTIIPYLSMAALLIRGLTLPGGADGVRELFNHSREDGTHLLSSLSSWELWYSAGASALQIGGTGFGVHLTLASFNRFNHSLLMSTVIVFTAKILTGVLWFITIYSLLGHSASVGEDSLKEAADLGPSLIFVTIPAALASVHASEFWTFLLFLHILLVALGSQVCLLFALVTALMDEFPALRKLPYPQVAVGGGVCLICLVLTLPFCISIGLELIVVLNASVLSIAWFISGVHLFVAIWIYGFERFSEDVKLISGAKPWRLLKWVGGVLTMIGIIIICSEALRIFIQVYGHEGLLPCCGVAGVIALVAILLVIVTYGAMRFRALNPTTLLSGLKPDPAWWLAAEDQQDCYFDSIRSPNSRGMTLMTTVNEGEDELVSNML